MWYEAPNLNTERVDASSCELGAYIYTFGGLKSQAGYLLKTFERLNADLLTQGEKGVVWERFEVKQSLDGISLSARERALMVAVSDGEILIMGGEGNSGHESDCFLLDTETSTLSKQSILSTGLDCLQFSSWSNQCYRTDGPASGTTTITALV